MALPQLNYAQRDFSAGQVTGTAARRDDLQLQRKGLRKGRNIRILNTGAVENRFGRSAYMLDQGRTEIIRFSDTLKFEFLFGDGAVRIRNPAGDLLNEVSGMPWTLATVHLIRFAIAGRDVVIFYPGSRPRVLRYGLALTVPAGAGMPIGNMASGGGLVAAFDGITNRAASSCATRASQTSAYAGLNVSAAPQKISRAIVRGSNNQGYVTGANPSVTLTLRGKQGAVPPANAADGTSLATTTFTDSANEAAARILNSSNTSTDFDHLWVQVEHNGSNANIHMAQITFEMVAAGQQEQWSLVPFIFDQTPSGAPRQPYFRFAPRGIAMTPSARTGAITVAFDGPVLESGHVDTVFRYHERELLITSVSSPTTGAANVIETLPPTRRVNCGDASARNSFQIGQVVIGATTQAEGLVVGFNSTANLDVIVHKGDNFAAEEKIVSNTGLATVTGTPSEISAAASAVWDEAVIGNFRGWPAGGVFDRGRLTLFDFPQLPDGIGWSGLGSAYDLHVGADADNGFFEVMGGSQRVRHVAGGADQFVLTDQAAFYIPISSANPLRPGGVEFRLIGAPGASPTAPAQVQHGIVYVAANGRGMIAIAPTGQTSFPYALREISEFHAGLIVDPIAIAAMSSGTETAEQYLWVVNADGALVVGRYDQENEWVGFVPVDGQGTVKWVASLAEDTVFNVKYQESDALPWTVERLDENVYLDGTVPLNAGTPSLRPSPDNPSLGRLWMYAGLEVDVMLTTSHLGRRAVDENGYVVAEPGDDFSHAEVVAGLGWVLEIEPWLPNRQEGEAHGQRLRRRRVKKTTATVQDATEFTFMGRRFAVSDGTGAFTPLTGAVRSQGKGRSFEPSIRLEKTVPGPFRLVELAAEIAG